MELTVMLIGRLKAKEANVYYQQPPSATANNS